MRKILSILSAAILGIQCSLLPVSCNSQDFDTQFRPDNIYFLGDSLTDDGALAGIANDVLTKNNWEPGASLNLNPLVPSSSIDLTTKPNFSFDSDYFNQNRFSNGSLAAEQLAKNYNLKISPAWDYNINYKQPIAPPFDVYMHNFNVNNLSISHTGNDYAVGFAKAVESADDKVASNPIEQMIDNFSLPKQRAALMAQHSRKDLNQNSLVMICIGGDDLLEFLGDNAIYDHEAETELIKNIVTSIQSTINDIHVQRGVTHFLVTNIPNLRLLPKYNKKNTVIRHRVEMLTDDFNSALKTMLDKVNVGLNARLFDLYTNLDDLLNIFGKTAGNNTSDTILKEIWDAPNVLASISDYIVKNADEKNAYMLTSYWNVPRENIEKYAFLDSIHPSSWLQHEIGQRLIETME